ncbi:transposable element Tcb2 transposase, partial [Trichonephila clavipes]
EVEDIRTVWIGGRHDLRISIRIEHAHVELASRQNAWQLVPPPPVTIRELRLALQRRDGQQCLNNSLTYPHSRRMGRRCENLPSVRGDHIPTKDRMFLAGHQSQGCFGLQSHCVPCYFFNQASFYPSDFSFSKCCLHYTYPYVLGILRY